MVTFHPCPLLSTTACLFARVVYQHSTRSLKTHSCALKGVYPTTMPIISKTEDLQWLLFSLFSIGISVTQLSPIWRCYFKSNLECHWWPPKNDISPWQRKVYIFKDFTVCHTIWHWPICICPSFTNKINPIFPSKKDSPYNIIERFQIQPRFVCHV